MSWTLLFLAYMNHACVVQLYYEVEKTGRLSRDGRKETEFKSIDELELLNRPHAVKLCRMFDEKQKASNAGVDIRPLTTPELLKHMKEFGIEETIATRKIRWVSQLFMR